MKKGLLIVVSAPSGCGKGTILAEVLKDNHYFYSVSATTRQPRAGEINGIHYFFLSIEEFEERIISGGMLEYAEYCGHYYGTPRREVEEMLNSGMDVILEIEVKGAMKVKEICPDAVLIFIAPPSVAELERRLRKRGTENDEDIAQRISEAEKELAFAGSYDHIIVNDDLDSAVCNFKVLVEKIKTNSIENQRN